MHRSLMGHRLSVSRRFSTSSGQPPTIFGNTGVEQAHITIDEQPTDPFLSSPAADRRPGGLEAIAEAEPVQPPAGSTFKALPLLMILQVSWFCSSSLTVVWTACIAQHYARSAFPIFPRHVRLILRTSLIQVHINLAALVLTLPISL